MNRLAVALLLVPALAHAQPDPSAPPDEPPAPPAESPPPAEPPAPAPAAIAAPPPPAVAASTPAPDGPPRLRVDLELYARAQQVRRTGDDLSEVTLDRGELGATIALGDQADAELRLETIRSAAGGGALGIDGDSTVIRVKTAQVEGARAFGSLSLGGALGFVPDPWIRALEQDYTVKPLSRTASERLLGWPTSDLSARVTTGAGPVHATVTFGNGEGLSYPERNSGKTTTAVLSVTAVDTKDIRLVASGVARNGSIGVASIRDHRFGGGVTAVSPWVRGGAEIVAAYGLGDRADVEALVLGGWADGKVFDGGAWRLFASARGATLHIESAGGGRESTFGGALAVEPHTGLRVWLAVDRQTTSGNAMPLLGADPGDATTLMLIASAIAPFEAK